jgi:hypothetical protein
MNRFAITLASATALAAALIAAAPVGAHAADNIWHTDDGRDGSTTELQRVFAGCHMTAMAAVPPQFASGNGWESNIAQIGINMDLGRAIGAVMSECMRSKGWIPGPAPAAPAAQAPAPLNLPPIPPRSTKGLNANQIKVGCSWEKGYGVSCRSPGTGMCWKKGHNPERGQPASAISVGNEDIDPRGSDEGHSERCG